MSMISESTGRLVIAAPTLDGQLPDLPASVQPWERYQMLVRVIRTTAAGVLVAAPDPASRVTWLPLAKVQLDQRVGGYAAPWPLLFLRLPTWLYRRARLELLPATTPRHAA